MCGIVGSIGSREAVNQTRLSHRGPDAEGSVVITLPWTAVRLGMTRLTIVDQTPFPVPMRFQNGVSIAFNGEVYNWRSLRAELEDGTPWETECDVEVVARGWRRWGSKVLDRLNGMFAFALVDEKVNAILLARDRLGEKPMYLAQQGDVLHFASEAKALPIRLEEVVCPDAEVLEFDYGECTRFKGVTRLLPGHLLVLQRPTDVRSPPDPWWVLPHQIDGGMSWNAAVERTHELLVDSCRLRAISQVPWTVAVSGGLDSAMIQAIVKCPKVYCVTFPDDGIDNTPAAKLAAPDAEVVPVTFGPKEATATLPDVAYHLDTPGTWSALGLWFLAHRMAEDNVKVVLNGEGADELAAGYTRYRLLWWLEQAQRDPLLAAYKPTFEALHGTNSDILARLIDRSPGGIARKHAVDMVDCYSADNGLVADMARVEVHTTMQVLLRMADRMYSSVGVENRGPFFDYRLVELLATMPTCFKVQHDSSKSVLREVARRLGVHESIVNEKTKRGLIVPWNKWFPDGNVMAGRGSFDRTGFSRKMNAAWQRAFRTG